MNKDHKDHFIAADDLRNATEDLMGYCPDCEDWTRENTPPNSDAEHKCPDCGGPVYGASTALNRRMFKVM